jgi:hypothetical protein
MATDSEPTTISISPIKLSVQYSREKLDKLKSNYREWCKDVTIGLFLNDLYEYVTGDVKAPPAIEPRALSNWKANSHLAYAFLASSVSSSECSFMDIVRGHPSVSLPFLSSPTLPLFICISPTPLYHLQGPHPKPTTFVFKVRWLSGCWLTESRQHSISSSARTLAASDKPRTHWDMSTWHYGTLHYHIVVVTDLLGSAR